MRGEQACLILFSYARRYISNMITVTDNFKLKEIAQPRVAPFAELLLMFFHSSLLKMSSRAQQQNNPWLADAKRCVKKVKLANN